MSLSNVLIVVNTQINNGLVDDYDEFLQVKYFISLLKSDMCCARMKPYCPATLDHYILYFISFAKKVCWRVILFSRRLRNIYRSTSDLPKIDTSVQVLTPKSITCKFGKGFASKMNISADI